jgi:hypothetical protein
MKAFGMIGTGGLGVLSVGMIVSNGLKTGLDWIFGLARLIFVSAGAIALISRSR